MQSAAAAAEEVAPAAAGALAVGEEPAPGAHAAIPRLITARPMPLRTRRRSMSVWTSNASPWSHAGSVGSGSGRPSNVGGASAVRLVVVVMASPAGNPGLTGRCRHRAGPTLRTDE